MKPYWTAALVLLVSAVAEARAMTPPRLEHAAIDWPAAFEALAGSERTLAPSNQQWTSRIAASRPMPRALARLNAAMAHRFPGIAQSPLPVLLPFDTDAYLRDQAAGTAAADPAEQLADTTARYLSGFDAHTFFSAGPSGYNAAFAVRVSQVPELSDIEYAEPVPINLSASALLYELADPTPPPNGSPVAELEAEFPGIRRLMHEHHVRYTFTRFGVPYVASTACFDSSKARFRMPTCRAADRVIVRFLRALKIAGGTPQVLPLIEPLPVERPSELSTTFSYHAPGKLLAGTGFRSLGGIPDHTVYSQIRFPLVEAPAFVNSQMFQKRNKPVVPGESANYSYPWRDNFCERRGFPVGQCPAGVGHQGQDIRPAQCKTLPRSERCEQPHDVVAVRDGVVLRAPKQEALFIVVNTAHEHLRFRYLHMDPRKLDQDKLFSGRRVHEGEVVGQVGNFHKREGGTSYHLHFDVQVPTRQGWVYVNPYMTLVAAYERLIGERGQEFAPPAVADNAEAAASTGTVAPIVQTGRSAKSSRQAKRAKKATKSKVAKKKPAKAKKKDRLAHN